MSDIGTTRRRSMSPTRRLRIWEAHKGTCVLCKMPIDGTKEDWIVEHVRALALGGADEDKNCGPAHERCADTKTHDQDMPAITKAKRQKMRHLGIKLPSRMPGSRNSPIKRKLDGRVVDRRTGLEVSR